MKKIPQKSFTYNGKKYKAVHKDDCDGCAFDNTPHCPNHPGRCSDIGREDRKNVIWIEVKNLNPKKD